jgi:hypothetical protein
MIELIKWDEKERWNAVVETFDDADTYFGCQYAVSFMENEDGVPYLLYYESDTIRLCYPIIEKDISAFSAFDGHLPSGQYFDWNTPYGYGGPIANVKQLSEKEQESFKKELYEVATKRNVVSQFIRFHPILQNQRVCSSAIENVYIKDTIFINLDTEDDLMVQMDTKNRNLIRKAIKNGVTIEHDNGEHITEFMKIYGETMDRDNARDFYYFPESYYNFMKNNMSDESEYFYAYKDGEMIAASIFFYNKNSMHYHLSGSLTSSRTFAPTNLLLYSAANWGRDKGMKSLHLGGGVGIEDGLFHFKKQFNRNGRIGFYIGRNIFMPDRYQELLKKRQEINPEFDINNTYYIQYRKPEE